MKGKSVPVHARMQQSLCHVNQIIHAASEEGSSLTLVRASHHTLALASCEASSSLGLSATGHQPIQ